MDQSLLKCYELMNQLSMVDMYLQGLDLDFSHGVERAINCNVGL